MMNCSTVIYNIGIIRQFNSKDITFEKLHYEFAKMVIDRAVHYDIKHFILMSANGVKSEGTGYQTTKFRAEEYLKSSGLNYTIFRPSLVFGKPKNDQEFWGSLPSYAVSMGNDNVGISTKDDSIIRFNKALKFYTDKGFKLCFEDEIKVEKEIIIGTGLSSLPFLKKFLRRYIWLDSLVKKINNKLKKAGIYL